MKRIRLLSGAIAGVVALSASLLLARVHPFGDAGLYAASSATTATQNNTQASRLPADVSAMLVEKCADCHSDRTRAPFYGRFAPVSWLMERDIVKARAALNLSLWDTISADRRQTLAAKIEQETKANRMPPLQYRMVHRDARITDADQKVLAGWAHQSQVAQLDASVAAAGDPARGKALFEKRCTGCHALAQNREGPRLQGVYRRISGTAPGFAYSAALKSARIAWDDKSLEKWLTDPDAFIPGNDMDFLVPRPQDRSDLISYLKQTSGK